MKEVYERVTGGFCEFRGRVMGSLGNSLMEFEEEENMTQDSCQDNVVSTLFDWDLDQLLR